MSVVQRSCIVPYSAQEMFELVNDVPRYPEFLPWCDGGEQEIIGLNETLAEIRIAFKGVKTSFKTRNSLVPGERLEMTLDEGPFKELTGLWVFKSLDPTACRVSLDVQFVFSNRVLEAAIGPVFRQICDGLIDSFTNRAVQVYGQRAFV